MGEACLVAVKSYHLREVSPLAEASCRGRCICVSNGMGLEEEWGPGWEDRVEPALLTAGFLLSSPDRILTAPGAVIVRAAGAAETLFSGSPIPIEISTDLETARWAKWLANSVINPLGALTGLPSDRLRPAGLGPLIRELAEELAAVIPPVHRTHAVPAAARMLEFLLEHSPNRCSMLQDLDAGRRTEIAHLTGLCLSRNPGGCPGAERLSALVRARETAPRLVPGSPSG